ncbi:periplasmic heavy metal sensor [Geobacter pelophilus]|uniref:Periplasmic heavy metal sensor n=1 Tax=Geoanaerobacter pelophilus TaxID=60036 RepID=A0AAW4L680_9BACT|nr:periplasmic heavy metal sensor [Geoanaerobacter pelophilus]MBT0666483.1 periplasmic heavy metal sensor [Geoanaerobacter pelophilus]
MRISFLKIALAVSMIFNLSVLATAGYFYYTKNAYWVSPFGAKMRKDKFLFEQLSLQPGQVKKMREKALPFRAQIDRKRQEVVAKRNHLFNLMRADVTDGQAIKAALADISKNQAEIEGMVIDHILQEKATLDANQQQKFLDLIQKNMTQERMVCPPVGRN